ncbi:hypothetical protein B6I21_01385 [candidate division KSB1 bacterium 4572_119]|nr:MAG: hypothetical protein B6I21_01385 [candidate division KSB1 bacterium 4572_119]
MKFIETIDDLSKEKLLILLKNYAKNWLAHDGCWFLSVERKFGMEVAIEMDTDSWRMFTVIEAKRLIDFLELGKNSGIDGLKRALRFRLYASLNEDEIIVNGKTLEYRVKTCRVQSARRKKSLADFPCSSVGIVEYGLFAKTIDERFETERISCPPEITNDDYYCIWRFKLLDK